MLSRDEIIEETKRILMATHQELVTKCRDLGIGPRGLSTQSVITLRIHLLLNLAESGPRTNRVRDDALAEAQAVAESRARLHAAQVKSATTQQQALRFDLKADEASFIRDAIADLRVAPPPDNGDDDVPTS